MGSWLPVAVALPFFVYEMHRHDSIYDAVAPTACQSAYRIRFLFDDVSFLPLASSCFA